MSEKYKFVSAHGTKVYDSILRGGKERCAIYGIITAISSQLIFQVFTLSKGGCECHENWEVRIQQTRKGFEAVIPLSDNKNEMPESVRNIIDKHLSTWVKKMRVETA